MVGLNSLWRRQQQRPTEEAGADPGPAPTPTATVASASDVSTIASASTVTTDPTPQQPRPLPPNAGNSEHERMLSAAAAASAAVAVASAGADDKAHGGVASMEGEEVVKVKRGGSQGSSGNHGKQPRPQSQRGLVKQEDEEGKVEQAGASPAPGLEAQRKARSLPTVLRSSHRGGAFCF